jgi:hypothetical protein
MFVNLDVSNGDGVAACVARHSFSALASLFLDEQP